MANKKIKTLLVLVGLLSVTIACSSASPQTESTVSPTQSRTPGQAQSHFTEADVPRITVEDAKAAVDGGEAIIVDVRSAESFAAGHIAGAISIPLAEFETNISNIALEKDQWIITYCT